MYSIPRKNHDYLAFRFKGLSSEINKLTDCLSSISMSYSMLSSNNDISEINVYAQQITSGLVQKFPLLKVTGLCQNWSTHEVEVYYSESGYPFFTKFDGVGYFDKYDEELWFVGCDMMDEIDAAFTFIQTGEKYKGHYTYPFKEAWNNENFVIETEEGWFIKQDTTDINLSKANCDESLFEINNGKLLKYKGKEKLIVIPDTVTDIEPIFNSVFNESRDVLEAVLIPGTIKNIKSFVFKGFKKLKKVVIEEGVESIGDFAFSECSSLVELLLPDSLQNIEKYAFSNCQKLNVKELKLPKNLINIQENAFSNCFNVPDVLYNEAVKAILYYDRDEDYEIPYGTKVIGSCAFKY